MQRFRLPVFFALATTATLCGFGCATGPESVPRGKVTADMQAEAATLTAGLEAALAAKDLVHAAELAAEIDLKDPYTPRNSMAVARTYAAIATRDGNPRSYADAMRRADGAVEAAPDDPDLRMARGRLQFDRRYYGKAIEDFARVAELRPGDRDARRMIAFSRHHLRQPKQERKAWEELLAIAPDDADAHYFLGAVLLRSSDATDVALGEQHVKVAIEKSPQHRLALQALAFRAWEQKDYALAEQYLTRAVVLSNATTSDVDIASPAETIAGEASILFSLGAVQQAAGRNADAAKTYEQCLVFDPAHARASANLGQLLLDLGDPDQGLRRLRDALELEEDKDVQKQIEDVIDAAEKELEAERVASPPQASPAAPADSKGS